MEPQIDQDDGMEDGSCHNSDRLRTRMNAIEDAFAESLDQPLPEKARACHISR